MALSQGIRLIIDLVSLAVLARFIAPESYGLIGMVGVVVALLALFSNIGLVDAIIQRTEITREQVDALFWLNLAVGAVMSILLCGLSPLVSIFYGQNELTKIIIFLSSGFTLRSLGLLHRALLVRNLQHKILAYTDVLATAVAATIAIVMAVWGLEYWALVARTIALAVVTSGVLVLATGWIPGRPRRNVGVRHFLRFGANTAATRILNFLPRSIDTVIVGRLFGPEQLGYYERAYRLTQFPMQCVNAPMNLVVYPIISSLKEDPARFKKYYSTYIKCLSYATLPLLFFLSVAAYDAIYFLMGEGWEESATLFIALLPLSYVLCTYSADSMVYQSLDRTHRQFRWYRIESPTKTALLFLGIPWGGLGVAIVASATWILARPFALSYCYRDTPVSLVDYLSSTAHPFLLSVLSAAFTFCIYESVISNHIHTSGLIPLLIKAGSYLTFFVTLDLIWPTRERAYQTLFNYYKISRGRKRVG